MIYRHFIPLGLLAGWGIRGGENFFVLLRNICQLIHRNISVNSRLKGEISFSLKQSSAVSMISKSQSTASIQHSTLGKRSFSNIDPVAKSCTVLDSIDAMIARGFISGQKRPNPRNRKKRKGF